ncbi:TetR/AcrR family transcriptional regulator [Streptomyces angustmyceticus]|uniref:TetR family transcriptional regulator n=1 Tax=Streptomyces angustmyceticus TaxID=285578 RepID=A0A5J4LFP4_9ACTN|nr:TetR/AcrR family transcriptional regulator [Streptomyces angustmyceticus]UAL68476.1 TetR/AcrR family transcriptional regulator [Streptomyces angustmyceticus]GES32957.1 TetR family transcriptional regulator [Streptomyces angustmyceticus]
MGAVKSKRVPRAVREQQMLDAAVLTFARRGYSAASMDEIAEAAGVSKPLVYLYLNSKEDLFSTVIRRESEALVAAVAAAVEPGATADRQLWSGLKGFFAHTAAHPHGWAVLHQQARTHGEPFTREVAAMRAEIIAFVTKLIGAAAKETGCVGELAEREVAGLAHALVGAAESLAEWVNVRADEGTSGEREHPSAKDTAATMMNFVWAGLGRLTEGGRWAPDGLAGQESASGVRR